MVSTTEQMKVFGYTPESLDQEVEKYTGKAKEDFAESKLEEKRRANHPLNNVPFFQRPVNASTDDIEISTSDPDVRAFKNKFDETYTIATSPDQRVEREKLRDGIISSLDGVKGYLENPFLPNKEQVADFVKGAAVGTLEQIKQSMESGASYGDIFGTLTGVGAASTPFKVPKGSLRLFGGVSMEGATKDKNLKKAIKTLKDSDFYKFNIPASETGGISYDLNKQIWNDTGWYVDPADGQWRYFIDDTKSKFKNLDDPFLFNMAESTILDSPKAYQQKPLKEVFEHPKLYQRYPEFKDYTIKFVYAPKASDHMGIFDGANKELTINIGARDHYALVDGQKVVNDPTVKRTVLHELQHAIQAKEGFVRGTRADDVPEELVVAKDKELRAKRDVDAKKAKETEADFQRVSKRLQEEKDKILNNPLPGLTAKQEIEIYQKHYLKPDKLNPDVTWASTAKEYGMPVSKIQKAANRNNLVARLSQKFKKSSLENNRAQTVVYGVERDLAQIEMDFYQGAGGEIESRLAEDMLDNPDMFPIDARAGMLEYEGNKYGYQGKYGVDPLNYEIKPRREPESTNLVDTVKKKLGLSDNVKSTEATLEDYGYYQDNPATKGREGGEDWVKKQQRYAEEDAARGGSGATKKFFNGPITANLGGMDNNKALFLDSKFLASLKGANDEVRNVSDSKYQGLLKDAQDNSFDPNQKGNRVVVGVNHKGEAYIIEGNTRAAVASELGIPSVKVEVRYWNGAETVDGPYSPQNILKYASKEPKNFAEGGDTVRPEPRPEAEVDVSPRAEAGDQFFVEQAERNKPFPNVKPKPRPNLDKNKGRTYDIYSVEIDGRETNVIEFKDGKRISAPQIQQMFMEHSSASEARPGKQTSREISNFLEKNNPTYDEFVKHFTAKRLNKGGAMMEEQMQMAFMDEGGLKDDGMEKDPVSGNEVPSGSMAKEVRDDIPAQLSEGEYVVPADVVRYYGVKFFEDLRERAKMGLQDMEMNGRIGGEPVPAGGPVNNEELSPEEMQAIQEMMGMAQGGAVNMYKQQQELYTAPNPAMGNPMQMNQGGQVSGYDQAGAVTANQPAPVPVPPVTSASVEQDMLQAGAAAQQSNFGGFPLGSTIFPSEKTGKTILETMAEPTPQTVTLYSPNYLTDNQTITLTLPAQDALYQEKIAEGYTTQPPVAPAPSSGGGVDIRPPAPPPREKIDYTTYEPDELLEAFDKNRKTRMALLALGAVNPVIALFGQGATRMQEKEILAAMKGRGMKIPEDEGGILSNITDFVSGLFGKDKEEIKNTVIDQSSAVPTKSPRPGAKPKRALDNFRKSEQKEIDKVRAAKERRKKRGTTAKEKAAAMRDARTTDKQDGKSTGAFAKREQKTGVDGLNIGGRNKGGLMTKGKKK